MENAQIAGMFDEIADLLEMKQANPFRVRAYRNAARTLTGLPQRVADLIAAGEDLSELPNIGDSTAEKIREIVDTGTCRQLEELRQELPSGLMVVMRLPGIGPRKAMQLFRGLEIQDLDDLERACRQHRVRDLEGFGPKTEENILRGLRTVASATGRLLLREATEQVDALVRHLHELESVQRWEIAGSFRRWRETIGDLDILLEAKDREQATEDILAHKTIERVESRGRERVTVILDSGLQVDFRFFEPDSFGAAWLYFTGSKAHNIILRKRAQQQSWKLNEYGLFEGDERLAGRDEAEIYRRLDLDWIPPELREDRGEIEAAAAGRLPRLVQEKDIHGDLQSHTEASDGQASIEEMARAARQRGLQYLAITDHSQRVRVANGMDDDRCRRHADRIREIDAQLDDFWLLAGVEVDVLESGKLDLQERTLAELDWVVASIHYGRKMSEKKMTERLLAAVESGLVHCLGHPLGRLIGRREPLAYDTEKVFRACAEHGVFVEINAQPDRLDLPDIYCQRAREMGVRFTIGTDAHSPHDLDYLPFGVAVARRGWLGGKDILNTRTARQLRREIVGK